MAMAAQGMSLGQPRASTFLSGRSQGKASACERLLEAKDAEVLRLRSELEAWRSKECSGGRSQAAKPSGSSRRLHVDLSACQRHQEYSAKAAAKASRELCSQAAVNLEEARERLHLATESLEGCEAFSRDLRDSLMKQRAIETSAWESLREAEQLEDEVQLQIHVRHAHIEEADEELLRLQLLNNEEEARLAQTEKVINDITSKQEACRAVFRQGEWTWQQLVQEQKALDVELEAQRPRLREEQEEHAAAFQQLEEEFQVLESLGQNLPQQTRELLDANREEQESWRAALRHTEQELWVAQRHLREQQKRNTAALAQCRRLANTQEAHAQAEAKRSYASQEAALQEARLRLNKVQMQARQQATRQKVNNAFKAPIFQQKYPERAPVLVNQAQCRGLPRIEKKLLVPRNMKVGELRKSLPRHLKIEDCTIPWENVRMLMAGDEVTDDQLMQEIYDCYVDPDDGGLHLALELGEDAYSSDYCPEMQPEPLPEVEAVETVSGPSLEQLEKLTLSLESATQEIAEAHEKKQQAIDRYTAEEERAERAEEREVEALSRLEQAETRVEQAEMTVESLEKDLEEKRHELLQCHEHINQEKEMREMCEAQCKSLEEELRQTQQTLRVAQHAAKQSTKDSSKAQEKQVALEEQLLAQSKEKDDLQRRLKHDDESILKLKEMCTQLKEKLAMKEEQTKTDLERARLQLQASLREGKKQKAELEEQSKAELDRARSQVKALQQEKQKILLEFEAVQREKASLAAEVKAFHAKAAEKEAQEDEDIVLVGWDGAGKPVDSEDAIDSPEGFQLVQP